MNHQAELAGLISREKHWEECSADEKIDRLRDTVATTCRLVQRMNEVIYKLGQHGHHCDTGELLVPFHLSLAENQANALGGYSSYTHDNGIPYSLRTERERK